jgi:hypothetical protein
MTVAQLIEVLQSLDQDARVLTQGYEGGYCDVDISRGVELRTYIENVYTEWYYGPHSSDDEDTAIDKPRFKGYVL